MRPERAHVPPSRLHCLQTLTASWWPESAGVGNTLCLKSVRFEVCLGLEAEQTQEAPELRGCQTVSQRPKQTLSSLGEKPAGQTKHAGRGAARGASLALLQSSGEPGSWRWAGRQHSRPRGWPSSAPRLLVWAAESSPVPSVGMQVHR